MLPNLWAPADYGSDTEKMSPSLWGHVDSWSKNTRNPTKTIRLLRPCDRDKPLIVRHPTMPIEDLWAITREIAGDAATATHSGAPFIEVSATGITKASALAHLCDRLGIAQSETIAIGDMPNDLPMLAWAGHSVAVANAHPEVRAAANEITASNEDDGVAQVLERLINGERSL